MLVLGRNLGDTIVINDNIIITVFESNQVGDKFKIAIDAPRDVSIRRGELCDATAEQQAKLARLRASEEKKARKAAARRAAKRAEGQQEAEERV